MFLGAQPATPTGPATLKHAKSDPPTNDNLNVRATQTNPTTKGLKTHRTAWDCLTDDCQEGTDIIVKGTRLTFDCVPKLNQQGVWDGECGHSREVLQLTPDSARYWRYAGHANFFKTTWKGCPTTG